MHIGYIGLGKMGLNMVTRLVNRGYRISAFDVNEDARKAAEDLGAEIYTSLQDVIGALPIPRIVWLMVPHNVVDETLNELKKLLSKGDLVIDGGNSLYKDSMRRAKELEGLGIRFMDVGVSGGPKGALEGACLMIGGNLSDFRQMEMLFEDLTEKGVTKYAHVGRHGTGHFVKMLHNGAEYGMMQAIAETFALLEQAKKTQFPELDLRAIADLYNHGSVIESRLMGYLVEAFDEFGEEMEAVSGKVGRSGEGDWAIDVAKEMGIFSPVLQSAVHVRKKSQQTPSYVGKLLTAMRNRFGGHKIN